MVEDALVRNCHSGRDLNLSLIREKFWIVHAKSLIKRKLFDCHYFKRQRVLPKTPLMSKLPVERLFVVDQLFAHTGVDSLGTILVKLNKKTRTNQAVAKQYSVILHVYLHVLFTSNWQEICQLTVSF